MHSKWRIFKNDVLFWCNPIWLFTIHMMSLNLVLSEMVAIHEHIIKNIWNRNLDSDIQTKRLNQILIEKVDCAVNYYCRNWHWCQFNFLRWNLEKYQIMFGCLFQWTSIPYSTVQCQGHRPDTFRLEKSNKVNIFQFFRGHYFVVDLHLPLLELGLHAIQFIWQIFQCVSFEMALELKWFILDPMLIKPKCVWEAIIYFSAVYL